MRRTRINTPVRFYNYSAKISTGAVIADSTWVANTKSLNDNSERGGCMCRQEQVFGGYVSATSRSLDRMWEQFDPGWFIQPSSTYYIVQSYENSLNWKKLSSSNQAGLLQNLAELDDTVAMFGKNLLQSASYGGYKWGWAPLMNDISAVNDTVVRCQRNPPGTNQPYADTNSIRKSIDLPYRDGILRHTWTLTTKYEGFITYDYDILSYYDFIGFHPSPKVIWDSVPLSFAADWVLPIGDMLDAISPTQGWVKAVNFTGWRMITATVIEQMVKPYTPFDKYLWSNSARYFSRDYLNNTTLEQKTIRKEIGLKWPTFSNILDYGYLSKSFFSKRK